MLTFMVTPVFLLHLKVKMVGLLSTSNHIWVLSQDLNWTVAVMIMRQYGLKFIIQKAKNF